MSRVDEMRDVVSKLAGKHVVRTGGLEAMRRNVQKQRGDAAEAIGEMASQRAVMSMDLRSGLAANLMELRDEVQTTLGGFIAERRDMAADLKEQLAATRELREGQVDALRMEARELVTNVAADRQAMAQDLFAKLSDSQIELGTDVRSLLSGFTDQHAAMSQALDASLAAGGAERHRLVGEMIASTQDLLNGFAADSRATAKQVRETLSADRSARQELVAGMIVGIRSLLTNIASDNDAMAAGLRADLASDHQARSAATTSFMAETNADRRVTAEALANRLDAFRKTLEAEVTGALSGFATERTELHQSLSEMAQVWREFAANMHGHTEPEHAEQAGPIPTPAKPPAEDITDRVLAYLAEHPGGAKLVDLEPGFELSRPQLGRFLRNLMDSGRIVKDPDTLVYKLA